MHTQRHKPPVFLTIFGKWKTWTGSLPITFLLGKEVSVSITWIFQLTYSVLSKFSDSHI